MMEASSMKGCQITCEPRMHTICTNYELGVGFKSSTTASPSGLWSGSRLSSFFMTMSQA